MKRILNLEYGSVFASYWMYYGVVASFCSAFLLEKGYSNSEIGVILAVASIISVILQPLLADWADRSKKLSVINVGEISVAIALVLTLCLFVFIEKSSALWLIYVLIMAMVLSIQPIFNSLCFKLEETGNHINFGACRGGGSLGYAIMMLFLGTVVENRGIMVLPVVGTVLLTLLIIILFTTENSFKKAIKKRIEAKASGSENANLQGNGDNTGEHSVTSENEEINLIQFMKRNKLFVALSFGVVFLFFQNYILNNYMLQVVENVGGTAEDMGRIFSVMAFVELPGLFFFEKIKNKFGCKTLIKFSAIMFVLKIFVIYIANSVLMIYVAHFFHIFSFAIFLSAMVSFTDEIMEKGEAVKGQALYTAAMTISSIFSSIFGGVLLDISGAKSMLLVSVITAIAGTVMIVLLVGRFRSNNQSKKLQ